MTSVTNIDAQFIAENLDGHPSGRGFDATCPLCGKHKLTITDGDNGRPLVNCWVCGKEKFREIVKELDSRGLWPDEKYLSPEEMQAHLREAKRKRVLREEKKLRLQAKAVIRATAILEAATGDPKTHPYTINKGRLDFGSRVKRGYWHPKGWDDALLIPLYDIDRNITTISAINVDGSKDLLPNGRKKGCFYPVGKITGASKLVIAEGLATLASVCASTGLPGVMAVDAGNLQHVAVVVRELAPDAEILIVADDDHETPGNPGKTAVISAGKAIGCKMAIPDMGRKADAWDVWNEQGPEAVKQMVERAVDCSEDLTILELPKTGVTDVTDVHTNNDGVLSCNVTEKSDVTDVTGDGCEKSPFFVRDNVWRSYLGEQKKKTKMRAGVWYLKYPTSGKPAVPVWICSPIHVDAVTFDGQENNFGRLLRLQNTLGRWRVWSMPMELLRGDGSDLRGELLAMGVEIDPKAKNELANYIQSEHPKRRVHCALQVGWSGCSYVLPDVVIGDNAADVIFQSGERGHYEHTTAGTLAGWKAGIAEKAVGNPLLMLAISGSFVGPMLAKTHSEGGGPHFQGDSSTGKTTLLNAACSTWGGPNFKRSWRTTANGMEGAAALFNDCLLALDEISECDPREVGAIVYALGNGCGKQRASRTGRARSVTTWRCFVMSSGERTIGTTMAEGGHRVKAGQSVRLLDIPVARKYGAFDDLHGELSGSAFSDNIKSVAVTHHGHAGRAFLEKLTRDQRNFGELLELLKSLPGFSPNDGEGQEKRVAGRFALMALAGELATEYGLTGWPEGAAVDAAVIGFDAWRSLRGKGNDERRQIAEKMLGFIERHGDSRFSDSADNNHHDIRVINRAGWYQDDEDGREYLFSTEGMREATQGFELKRALDVLQEIGALLPPTANGERSRPKRIGGRAMRLYCIRAEKLGDASHGA